MPAPEGAARKPRRRLLFLAHTCPYPPHGGVEIRAYNVLRLLAKAFDVRVLGFYRGAGGAELEHRLSALRAIAPTDLFPIPQEGSRVRLVWDHLRSVALGRVYTEFMHDSRPFRRALAEATRDAAFDVVHVDNIDLSAYLSRLSGLPVVCVHHNVESQLLARRAEIERSGWRRAYVRHQGRLMEQVERRWCRAVALNVVVSEDDRRTIETLAPGARCAVVPNGVDVQTFRPEKGRGEGLVFAGGLNWFPNLDALEYFAAEILPAVRALVGDVPVRWVGKASDGDRRRFATSGIELTGYVEDIRPYVRDAACYVVPLRVGGGTRLKILDAWAMGKAVVSTSIGCEGLAAEDGGNILVRDTPEAFAEGVALVLRDASLRARLEERARATAEERYSWDVIGRSMIPLYESVMDARNRKAAL